MTTVLTHGVFDLLHPGHIEHLEAARAMGDRLVVSVTADRYVNKGPGRPVFNEMERLRMVRALKCVDAAVLCVHDSAVPVIEEIRPDIYCKGREYQDGHDMAGNLEAERRAVESYGGKLVFTDTPLMSSTSIINAHMPPVPEAASEYLRGMRLRYRPDDIYGYLADCKDLHFSLIGEHIIDEYIYVEPRGRSAKEAVITWQRDGGDRWAGGIDAVEGHMRAVCKPAIMNPIESGAIIKTRYVQKPWLYKAFALVSGDSVNAWPNIQVPQGNLLVADFGHGLIPSPHIADLLRECSDWLALTVQANSLNWGLNTLRKWPGANYVILDEPELRLALEDAHSPIHDLMRQAFASWSIGTLIITRGHNGAIGMDASGHVYEVPALATKVVDRIGAGDAFLAVTSPLVRVGAPLDITLLVGSLAAAIQVGVPGNSDSVTEKKLRQWIKGVLG